MRPSQSTGRASPETDRGVRTGSGSGLSNSAAPEFGARAQSPEERDPANHSLTSEDPWRDPSLRTATRPSEARLSLDPQSMPGEQRTPSTSPDVFAGPTGLLPQQHQQHHHQRQSIGSTHLISPELQTSSIIQHISPFFFSGDDAESPLQERPGNFDFKVTNLVESQVFDYYLRVVGIWVSLSPSTWPVLSHMADAVAS